MLRIKDMRTYGLEESAAASHLPMAGDPEGLELAADAKDLDRCGRLAGTAIGSGHDNWLNGIIVQFTVTAPRFWWPEMQRYHFIDFVSSSSTMHMLRKVLRAGGDLRERFDPATPTAVIGAFRSVAVAVMEARDAGEITAAEELHTIKCALPEGWLQTARLTTDYRQLKTVYAQRKDHRLPEWREDFCGWIRQLPHSGWITGAER